ncbi:MAG: NAD(+)/NADH kinase [Candidatus Thermoplasmatota archaeon]|nr:NAD(+)/NADH kinase [Candidatus Thermoplasmatota archaeon]
MTHTWGLICNPSAKRSVSLARDVAEFLRQQGTVLVEQGVAVEINEQGFSFQEINKKADLVVTIGGDGTILAAMSEIDKPVFAINSGGMGFLSEVESKYALEGLKHIIEGRYNVEERAKLKITMDGRRLPDATNEVTIQTARIAKILYLKIFVENELIESMGADGVIIATPTGSTSYSLSVGGPIMDPAVNAMIIAPLAAFKLSARPWIIPLERKVEVRLLPKSKETNLVVDGRFLAPVTQDSDIVITGSEKKARFIRFGESFYQMVRLKLMR